MQVLNLRLLATPFGQGLMINVVVSIIALPG